MSQSEVESSSPSERERDLLSRLSPDVVCQLIDEVFNELISEFKVHTLSECRRGRGGRRAIAPFLNFSLPDNFFSKIQNLGLEMSILGKFRERFEILSTHNLLCPKFAEPYSLNWCL